MNFENTVTTHDPNDPNPWLALYLDQSTPLGDEVKARWLRDCSSYSRQFLLPFVRPLARGMVIFFQIIKVFIPRQWTAPMFLHKLIVFGLKHFVRADANWLILRHFTLGSEILGFIAANVENVQVPLRPLKPKTLDDLRDNLFVQHDLNIFNFVININNELRKKNISFTPKEKLDFSMINSGTIPIEGLKEGWFNFIDLETAIELFTPVYQFFLTDRDFWRATNSLQLDETIGIYAAKILRMPEQLLLVNNKHPLVQMITLTAGYRLVLHGLASEMLHHLLVQKKRMYEKQTVTESVLSQGAP